MSSLVDAEKRRCAAWLCFCLVALALLCLVKARIDAEHAYAEYKETRVIKTKGVVQQADCSVDPATGTMECELIVSYRDEAAGQEVTRTFQHRGPATTDVPQIGATVLVGWTRGKPETAIVMRL